MTCPCHPMERDGLALLREILEDELSRLEATDEEMSIIREAHSAEEKSVPAVIEAYARLVSSPASRADAEIAIRGSLAYSLVQVRAILAQMDQPN